MQSILVVDDEPLMCNLCRAILEHAGYDVRTAQSGAEALRLLDERPVDLVVCDLFMPGLSGLEVIPEIRRRRPDLPVLVVTGGLASPDALPEALRRSGVFAVLAKPFTHSGLVAAVADLVEDRRV